MLGSRLIRIATTYTIVLWLAGFAWLDIIMAALGRLYGGLGLLLDLPYIVVTLLLALGLQAIVLGTVAWQRVPRFLLIGAGTVIATMLSSLADTAFNYWSAQHLVPAMQVWATGTPADWLRASFLYGWVYCLNVALVMLVVSAENAREQARQLAKAHDAAQTAQLTMLRFQLNPHFLFNSLNAISSLVLTKQNDRAELMIERLAVFLRSSNSSDPASLVTLADELSTTEEYLEVEAIRFGERMIIDLDIPADVEDVLVPSFLLQPIVENSIKYAVAPARRDITIRICAREEGGRLTLIVEDDGDAEAGPARAGTGVGLQNVRARLTAFFESGATCTSGKLERGFRVAIAIPALRTERQGSARLAASR